jgi:hypothetical protein
VLFRRFRILACIALIAWLIPSPAHAERCDQRCAAYVRGVVKLWNDAQQVTLFRQWIAGVVAATPEAQCVAGPESHGSYVAENAISTAAGKYQMLIGTSNNVARGMGFTWLVGVPASGWAWWDQELGFWWLWNQPNGKRNWMHPQCW